jgi:hypothetical protein
MHWLPIPVTLVGAFSVADKVGKQAVDRPPCLQELAGGVLSAAA